MRKYNEQTSLEPHFYEEILELIDEIAETKGESKAQRRMRLKGMLTALYALTNDLWESENVEIGDIDFTYIRNTTSDEMVIPSVLNFVIPTNTDEGAKQDENSDR